MKDGKKILLEQYMDNYHIRNQHQKKCKANPMITFKAIKELNSSDFNGNIGLLLGKLRQLVLRIIFPKRYFDRSKTHNHSLSDPRRPILNFRSDSNWATLDEIPYCELAVGFIGQFWQPTPNFVNFNSNPNEFKKFSKNGYAKAVLDFHVKSAKNGYTSISFETRILALDYSSYRDMRIYWSIITPGIWIVRKMWLLAIKKRAEYMQRKLYE